MTKQIELRSLGHEPDAVLYAVLADDSWFTALRLAAHVTGEAGVEWRQILEGDLDVDDWRQFAESAKHAVIESISGTLRDPAADWELPVSITRVALLLPDKANPEQIDTVREHMRTLLSDANADTG